MSRSGGRLVDVLEISHILGVRTSWLYEHARKGKIPFVRVGRYLRFDVEEVLAFLRKGENGKLEHDSVS